MDKMEKDLLKIIDSKYEFDFMKYLVNLLIDQDENNRQLIETKLAKYIEKEHKEHMIELNKATQESANWDTRTIKCTGGQLSPSDDNMWYR
jgi:hypothetical protein